MSDLYIVGGQQRSARTLRDGNKDWDGYQKGVIIQIDPETQATSYCAEYVSPPEVCAAENPAITFQASSIYDGKLYTCTQTEILVYSLPNFERLAYVSLPCFNDLHHVLPTPQGTILAANAGLEMVIEITQSGEVLGEWNILGEDPWGRFSRTVDYRLVSTKPHRSHPNFLFQIGDEIWATRFHQGDAQCVTNPAKRIHISNERIHDGLLHDGRLYFTSVDGKVIVANPETLLVEQTIDLNSMHPEGTLLGWCRGIVVDREHLWVGFSRIRPTKLRENVAWVMRGFKQVKPTHVACYDLARQQCTAEIDLEPIGINAVYSVFHVPGNI